MATNGLLAILKAVSKSKPKAPTSPPLKAGPSPVSLSGHSAPVKPGPNLTEGLPAQKLPLSGTPLLAVRTPSRTSFIDDGLSAIKPLFPVGKKLDNTGLDESLEKMAKAKETARKSKAKIRQQETQQAEIKDLTAKLDEKRAAVTKDSENLSSKVRAASQRNIVGKGQDFSSEMSKIRFKNWDIQTANFNLNLLSDSLARSIQNSIRRTELGLV